MPKLRSFQEYAMQELQNPEFATVYLKEALLEFNETHDAEDFLRALRDVTEAQGGIGELAKRTKLSRQNLYKVFSSKRQPRIETLSILLGGLGLSISVISAIKDGTHTN